MRLEAAEERDFEQWCARQGHLCKKMKTSESRGWPDRMIVAFNIIFFIEFKREGGFTSNYQKFIHDEIRKKGFKVFIAYTNKEAQEITQNELSN